MKVLFVVSIIYLQLLLISGNPVSAPSESPAILVISSTSDELPVSTASQSPESEATNSAKSEAPSRGSAVIASQSASSNSSSFNPSWNAMNITCDEWLLLEPKDQWQSVNADGILQTFRTMYIGNQLMCADCYGMSEATCASSDLTCQQGLRDLATSGNISRWDQALGVFAQSQSDLNCGIEDSSQCSQAPHCTSDHGPAELALLKSMTTMHNSLSNVYMAIDRAHSFATNQMGLFTTVFAPVPSLKNKAIFTEIMFVIAGLMAGFIPGIGAAFAGLLVGVGAAFMMNNMIFDHPEAADTNTVLAKIVSNTQSAYSEVADSLFMNGSYSYSATGGDSDDDQTTISWTTLMANGSLLQQQDNTTDALEPVYERILYQQLAVYTWKNLEAGDNGHIPFITFDNKPCDQIDSSNKSSLEHVIKGVSKSDTNITYNGACYFLLDGTTKEDLGKYSCIGKALPGGTNKDMSSNSEEFRELSISDFIIPSVKGWQAHAQQNDYQNATTTGQMYTDPQDAGAVSLPICDYLGKPDSPGVNCPRIGKAHGKFCSIYDLSTGINQPGDFVEGRCGVHVEQWQKDNGDENPLGSYQISAEILDNDRRAIGSATKQSAAETLDIVDSALPYNLYLATGVLDEDPIRFWYSDQYWNTSDGGNSSHQCSVGKYNHGSRNMDCSFDCKKPDPTGDPPISATVANPFPNTPIAAIGGDTTFSNVYITATPTWANATATPTPIYASGWCGVHIRQYQKDQGEDSMNDTPNFKIEVALKDGDSKQVAGPNALLPTPSGVPVNVNGLVGPFTVTAGEHDSDPLSMSFAGKTWDSDDKNHSCSVGNYNSGHRDMDCGFDC